MRIGGHALFCVSLSAFIILAAWILAGNPYPGWLSDSFFYLYLADFYSGQVTGAVPAISNEFYLISRFPPLFPICLALGGGGISDWIAAYHVTLAFGALAIGSTYIWLSQQIGSRFVAGALLPLAILSPQYFFLHLEILSESQFVFLVTAVLWTSHLYEQERCSLLTVAAIACLVPLSRSAGFALSIALTVWLLRSTGRESVRARILACSVIWLIPLAWMLYRRLYPVTFDYITDLGSPARDGILQLLLSIPEQLPRLRGGYAAWFDLGEGHTATVVASVVLILALGGWFRRVAKLELDALFLAVYIGLVCIWPYPLETARLLSVTMPVVALHAWVGLSILGEKARGSAPAVATRAIAALALVAIALMASIPRWIDISHRILMPLDPKLGSAARSISFFLTPLNDTIRSGETITRFIEMSKALPDVVGDRECVWTTFFLQTDFYSSYKVNLKVTPDGIDSIEAAKQKLSACRYLLVVDLVSPQVQTRPLYPADFVPTARPVLVSRISEDPRNRSRVSAALLDLKREHP